MIDDGYGYGFFEFANGIALTADDYCLVLCGAVASTPSKLKKVKYEQDKKDILLVMRYLTDCCEMRKNFSSSLTIIIINYHHH